MRNEDWFNLAICALLSTLGGLGRLLSTKNKKPVKLPELCRNSFVSLSIGVGIFMLINATMPDSRDNIYLVYAAGYFSGWAGPWLINGLIDKYIDDKGIKASSDDKK